MFSKRVVSVLAMIACTSIAAAEAPDEPGLESAPAAQRSQPATPDDHLETQLDWRSYYFVRPQTRRDLAGSATEPEPHVWLDY